MTVRILDPYAVPGEYCRVQLHCHTTASDGRFPPRELLRMYKDAGYSFVFITDHNRVTRCDDLNDATFLALPGTEDTVSYLLPPLGPHLGRLFVDRPLRNGTAQERIDLTVAAGGLASLCHPSWTGNLWTGTWPPAAATSLTSYQLIEIRNPHSDPQRDVALWESVLRARGSRAPVWGVAVDDCHHGGQFNRGWVMAKVTECSADALRRALAGGAFYASTGPTGRFQVERSTVIARFTEPVEARVLDERGQIRMTLEGTDLRYTVAGAERYVRIEAASPSGRLWSQAFWVEPVAGM